VHTRSLIARGWVTLSLAVMFAGAACSSSTHKPTGSANQGTSAAAGSALTISSASIDGYGSVLVDGQGHALYLLTSEQGASTFTCTKSNGCTTVWPPAALSSAAGSPSAGRGINPALLGSAHDPDGTLIATYGGWPLYGFARDGGPGQTRGEGITSFGGTWYLVSTSGQPVKSASSSATPSSSSGGGYGGY
jgi:predicted lipoprotein with Yx(FWY)xxD motif